MNPQLRRLSAIRAKLTSDTIRILRTCRQCGTEVEGDPRDTPCGQHPPAPAPQPGERTVTIERSYGMEAERSRRMN